MDFHGSFSAGFMGILHRPPSDPEVAAFGRYLGLLRQWNRAHSLTAYERPEEISEKLFLDSLLFLRWLPAGPSQVLDLGAGAGIPGLPMKIVRPEIDLTLIEARRRRTSFLKAVVRELGLEGVLVLAGRAERLVESSLQLGGSFDVVVTRAAAPPESILETGLAFLRVGGRFIASGPPAGKPTQSLPHGIEGRWVSMAASKRTTRQFLIVDKKLD